MKIKILPFSSKLDKGDSGGPMTDENEVHVGIVSWGIGCALANYPGVYAQTDYFLDWLAENSF